MSEFVGRFRAFNNRREDAAERDPAREEANSELPTLTRMKPRSSHIEELKPPRPAMEARQRSGADHILWMSRAAATQLVKRRRHLAWIAGLAALVLAGAAFFYYFTVGRYIYSTDDAYVRTDLAIISPKIAGYVRDVGVVDNQHVQAGRILARIDAGDYVLAVDAARRKGLTQDAAIARIEAQVDAQQAGVKQAEAQVDSARAERARAQSEFDRVRSLAASDFASKQRLDQVLADRDKAAAGLSGAEARLAGARADLIVLKSQAEEARRARAELAVAEDRARRDLGFAEIRAPFDGVVGNRVVEPGQYVQPGARLMAMAPDGQDYVEANFKETQLDRLAPGQKARVYVDAYDGEAVDGFVESIAPASGSEFSILPPENATGNFTKITQRFPVRIRLAHLGSGRLRAGMSVVVDVNTRGPAK
ncbi:HlyD family secretion protein [Rhodoblastus sp.]|uniref:HlyD family secretion protein n=1 Tax=Rhodoblastus sp. TaxID=1962975 RepID=UPI003F94DBAE